MDGTNIGLNAGMAMSTEIKTSHSGSRSLERRRESGVPALP